MHSAREGADQRTGFDARRQAWQTKCSHHHVSMIGGWCRGRRDAFNYNKKKKSFLDAINSTPFDRMRGRRCQSDV